MSAARAALRVTGAMLAALVITTWPMAILPPESMLGAPDLEAVDHVWTLWLALRDGPLVIDTRLVDFPVGYRWVLADPVNLPFFAAGHLLGGPGWGLSFVHAANLLLAGVAAVALGRVFLPREARSPAIAAAIAVTLPPLAAGLYTGQTEAQTFGWSALSVAATGWALRDDAEPRSVAGRVVVAGVIAGATAWAGAYALLYALLASIPVAFGALARGGWARARSGVARGAAIVALAALVAAPVLWATLTQRDAVLPGMQSLTPSVFASPERLDNRALGADLLRVVAPVRVPSGDDAHTVYLGGLMLVLAVVGVLPFAPRRIHPVAAGSLDASVGAADRSAARWLFLSAVWMSVLGLGVYLQAAGRIVRWFDGRILVLPAGLLSLWFEELGRAPRWYRALTLAGLLLAPLAASGARRIVEGLRPERRAPMSAAVALLVLLDAVWLAPLPWPRPVFHAAPPAGYARLDDGLPIVEVPLVRFATRVPAARPEAGRPDRIRHPALLWQTFHGRAIGGNPHQAGMMPRSGGVTAAVTSLHEASGARDVDAAQAALDALRDLGFGWIVHHPTAARSPAGTTAEGLRATLGPPAVDTPQLLAWRLGAPTTPAPP